MDLTDQSNEAVFSWLSTAVLYKPEEKNHLTWRVSTSKLYDKYRQWVRHTRYNQIPILDFWGIIQIKFPAVEILGNRGDRVYTALRFNYS